MDSPELHPEDFLQFVQLDEFVDDWESLGLDIERDLWDLEMTIMSNPEAGRVIRDTGGLRKLRFGRGRDNIGKSGGVRVCYAYFKDYAIILLVIAYGKTEKSDLSPSERKNIREYLRRTKAWLDSRRA